MMRTKIKKVWKQDEIDELIRELEGNPETKKKLDIILNKKRIYFSEIVKLKKLLTEGEN